jgi:hypothetical protein
MRESAVVCGCVPRRLHSQLRSRCHAPLTYHGGQGRVRAVLGDLAQPETPKVGPQVGLWERPLPLGPRHMRTSVRVSRDVVANNPGLPL